MIRLIFILAALASPVLAQDIDCSEAITQSAMNSCAAQEWEAADVKLNTAYKEVIEKFKIMDKQLPEDLKGGEEYLREAQRAWIAYRDSNCAAAGFQMRGGSAEPLLVYGCMREMTEDRTEELYGLLIEF
jgi:uncharacterized protein YecT (DUF1311 family)